MINIPILLNSLILTLGINAHVMGYKGYLYIAEYSNCSFATYSLSNPEAPTFKSRLSLPSPCGNVRWFDISEDGNLAYILESNPNNLIHVTDISNKSSPYIITSQSLFPSSFPKEIVFNNIKNNLYVATNSNQIQKWRLVTPTTLVKVAEIINNPSPQTIAVSLNNVFSGSINGNIDIYDLDLNYKSNISVSSTSNVTSLVAYDSVLYALAGGIIYIYDISDPYNLILLGSKNSGFNNTTSIKKNGNRLYAVNQTRLDTFYIYTPSNLIHLGSTPLYTGTAGFIGFYLDYGYVTGHFAPLTIDVLKLK